MIEKIVCLIVVALVGVIFWALFATAHNADKQQKPVYGEDGKQHSGLLEED